MDTRALNVLNRIRSGQAQWDTTKLQDPTAMQQQPAVPQGTGMETSPMMQALSGITGGPPSPELDAAQPLQDQLAAPSATQTGEMSTIDAVLKRRAPHKQNFLGGGNGI